jgi:hypothetical protein
MVTCFARGRRGDDFKTKAAVFILTDRMLQNIASTTEITCRQYLINYKCKGKVIPVLNELSTTP